MKKRDRWHFRKREGVQLWCRLQQGRRRKSQVWGGKGGEHKEKPSSHKDEPGSHIEELGSQKGRNH